MSSNYGLLSKTDINVLQNCLLDLVEMNGIGEPVKVLEIGVWDGKTAKGMREFLRTKATPIEYIGIESGIGAESTIEPPFPKAKIINCDSIAARSLIPSRQQLDLLIIDGCHCLTHACMDFLCYQSLVVPGGYALFHDINPAFQGVVQHHASKDHRAMPMRVAVLQAVQLLGLLDQRFAGWTGKMSEWEEGCSNGFFVAKKLKH